MEKFVIKVENQNESRFIQQMAFDAGCMWAGWKGDKFMVTDASFLFFNSSFQGSITQSCIPQDKNTVPFSDMAKIKELFSPKSEYEVGDWVKLTHAFFPMSNIAQISHINKILKENEVVSFKGYEKEVNCFVTFDSIERHATPDEIKKAKGDDIMVGEHKVEFLGNAIRVGCVRINAETIKDFYNVAKFMKYNNNDGGYNFIADNLGSINFYNEGCDFKTLEKIYFKIVAENSRYIGQIPPKTKRESI